MPEKDTIFSSKIKFDGIFLFSDFYQFCYDWLDEEMGLDISEDKYKEKIKGNSKEISVEWTGTKTVTDYFKFEVGVSFEVKDLVEVEVKHNNATVKTNKGNVELSFKGTLIRDYEGKFEKDAFRKFLRSIYEKWVITSRIQQFEEKLVGNCDDFLGQAKAWLALEGKR